MDKSTLLEYIESEQEVFVEAVGKESDRAVGIIAASWLDNRLEKLLCAAYIEDPRVKVLFKDDHLLQTFFAKVNTSYFSGLIPKFVYHDLKLIGEIRNRFAHEVVADPKFDDPAIVNRINRCELRPRTWGDSYPNRMKFMIITVQLGGLLSFLETTLSKMGLPKLMEVLRWDERPYQEIALTKEEMDEVMAQARESSQRRSQASKYVINANEEAKRRNYGAALELYSMGAQLDANQAIVYVGRGGVYLLSKLYDEAADDYSRAIDLDPNHAKAYANRGIVYSRLSQWDKALADSNMAIMLEPNEAWWYLYRATVRVLLKQYEAAITDCNKAADLNRDMDPELYLRIVEILIMTGSCEKALNIITDKTQLSTDHENRVLSCYLECLIRKLLIQDTTHCEAELDSLLDGDFVTTWSFEAIELWLEDATIPSEGESFIRDKIGRIKAHTPAS